MLAENALIRYRRQMEDSDLPTGLMDRREANSR